MRHMRQMVSSVRDPPLQCPFLMPSFQKIEVELTFVSKSPETVQCDRCKNFFHMACVTPPLLAKPSRGYGWTCAPCSRQHEEEVDSHEVRVHAPVASKPKSNAPAPRARGRPRKDRSLADKEESVEIKHFNMWPFRYFGCVVVCRWNVEEMSLTNGRWDLAGSTR